MRSELSRSIEPLFKRQSFKHTLRVSPVRKDRLPPGAPTRRYPAKPSEPLKPHASGLNTASSHFTSA